MAAAGRGDAASMWRLLSAPSRFRSGPTLAQFRVHGAIELAEGAGTFARARDLRVVLSDPIDTRWAVAAVSGTRRAEGTKEFAAYAVALRRTSAGWRIELGLGPRLTQLGTASSGRLAHAPPQLAVGVLGAVPVAEVGMWLDGRGFPLRSGGTSPMNLTAFGTPPPAGRGRHVVVAFASTGVSANAIAWTFSVR